MAETASDRRVSARSVPVPHPWFVGFVTWAVGALWFFRDPLFSGFDTITGDRGDARLVIFLHEHWWRVWQGEASWRSPAMFSPVDGTLGYSDTFVLDQVLYIPLRIVGFDQFVAFQLTLIGLTAIGFASLFTLMRRYLRLALAPSCLLSAAGVFANNVYVDTGHPQLYAINVVSLVALVFVAAWHASTDRWRLAGSAGGGLLTALLLWSTFYFGWFTIFFGCLIVLMTTGIGLATRGKAEVAATIRERWPMAAAATTGLIVGLVPFMATYLPILDDTERRSYDEVANLAPRPLDLVNVGRDNVAWGWLVRPLLDGDERLDQLNRAVAPTPLLFIVGVVATLALTRLVMERTSRIAPTGLAVGITAVVAAIMPIQFGFGGLWAWAHRLVPGATALRVFARVEVVAALLLCLTIACWLGARAESESDSHDRDASNDVESSTKAPAPTPAARPLAGIGPVMLGVLAVICFEQLNTTGNFRQFDRSDELAMLADTSSHPDGCDVFYITDAGREVTDHTLISAMLIAHERDIPTLNGYSGQRPPGWQLLPWEDGYETSIEDWVATENVDASVCALEVTTLEWSGPREP